MNYIPFPVTLYPRPFLYPWTSRRLSPQQLKRMQNFSAPQNFSWLLWRPMLAPRKGRMRQDLFLNLRNSCSLNITEWKPNSCEIPKSSDAQLSRFYWPVSRCSLCGYEKSKLPVIIQIDSNS